MLLAAAFLDELSGVPVVEAPSLAREHGLGPAAIALVLLVAPQLLGSIAEARLLLLAERGDIRRWIAGAHGVLAACLVLAALAPSAWVLGIAFAISSPAGGVACDLAQGSLVEGNPDARERMMARWTLAGALGDMAAPALVAAVALFGFGWRGACAIVSVAYIAHAIAVLHGPPLPCGASDDDEGERETRIGFREALRNRTLMLWLAATCTCSLLDEAFVILAASWLRDGLGTGESAAALALLAWAAGSSAGLLATERLLDRASPRRILAVSAIACVVACLGWLAAPTPESAAAGLFLVGVACSPLYPIVKAQAFAACPGRPALVGAADQIFVPVEIALMLAIGVLAECLGTRVALAAMVFQPLVVLVLVIAAWPGKK